MSTDQFHLSLDWPLEPVTTYMYITGKMGVVLSTCTYL